VRVPAGVVLWVMDWGALSASELGITLRLPLVSELEITSRLLCREVVSLAGWVVR